MYDRERLSGTVLMLRALTREVRRAVRRVPGLDDPVLLIMTEEAERMVGVAERNWGLPDPWAEHPARPAAPRFTNNVVQFRRRNT